MNEKEEKSVFDCLYALTKSLTNINNTLSCLRFDIQLLTDSIVFSETKSFKSLDFNKLSGFSHDDPESPYTRAEILKKLFPALFSAEISLNDEDNPITIDPCPKSNTEGG